MKLPTANAVILTLSLVHHALATVGIASWEGLRGVQIQSRIILEGGIMTNGTFSDGQWLDASIVQHSYGVYYQIDLTKSFDANNQNASEYMIAGLPETSDTRAPNYIAGGIFSNDYQFYTWGGLADKPPIGLTSVILGSVFPPDPSVSRFDQGVSPNQPTDDVSDNITSGAYASSPDQGLGFYFSGMVSATGIALEYNSDDAADNHPTKTSPTFTKVDMTTANDAKFQSMQWPDDLTPRAEGALVWLPYGAKGVLVAIGGVEVPGDRFIVDPPRITNDGPFMTELAIYDIDADTWFTQQTLETGEKPTQLASFCTVVVPTQDGNSQEIFVYGGYDGTYNTADPNVRDDVWVLSVPSFQWTKVMSADVNSVHGRQGNVCFSPNPTSMVTIGGTDKLGGHLTSDTIVDVLDLNSLNWTGKFDASSSDSFIAPGAITSQLGWPTDGKGPGASYRVNGLNDTLNQLFSTKYTGAVKTYYPYSKDSGQPKKSSGNHWETAVIATLCVVIPVALFAIVIFCGIRKRRKNNQGMERAQRNRKQVFSWLKKSSQVDPVSEKTNKSSDTASTLIGSHPDYFRQHGYKNTNGQIYEAPSAAPSPAWLNGEFIPTPLSPDPHEIMDHPTTVTTTTDYTIERKPLPPRPSLRQTAADQSGSASTSRFSETFPHQPLTAHTVTSGPMYELPHETSTTALKRPDNIVGESDRAVSAASHGRPSMSDGGVVLGGLPSSEQRPGHTRNVSSVSSAGNESPSSRPEPEDGLGANLEPEAETKMTEIPHPEPRESDVDHDENQG